MLDEDDVALVQVNGAMTNLIFRAQNLLTNEVGCWAPRGSRPLPCQEVAEAEAEVLAVAPSMC